MSNYQTIALERAGALATLTLNRPEHRNGMTNRMVCETHEALSEVATDNSLRVLLLTGSGDTFCPGADLNWVSDGDSGSQDRTEAHHFQIPALLHAMPQLSIAAINGACAGAAMGWVCGCDLRVARQGAMLNTAFLNVAVAGDMGLPWSLPRLLGAAKARELSFFSEKFSAEEAQRIGLIARLYSAADFSDAVAALCQQFLDRSPTALRTMKSHYLAAEHMPFAQFLELETERHTRIVSGPHAAEAFKAFIEKRQPNFDG